MLLQKGPDKLQERKEEIAEGFVAGQGTILKVSAVLGGCAGQVAGGGEAQLGRVKVLRSEAAALGGAPDRSHRGGTAAVR